MRLQIKGHSATWPIRYQCSKPERLVPELRLRAVDPSVIDHRADLRGANLAGAELTNARLRRTNLTDANLKGATLTDALMGKTNLSGADLTEAKGTRAEQLEFACGNANTRLPDGLSVRPC